MDRIIAQWKRYALTLAAAAGMMAFSIPAQAWTPNAGSSGSEVRAAQQALKTDGYYHGNVDGQDGRMTQSAIRHYQHANNLKVNGRLDNQTCARLGIANTGNHNNGMTNTANSNNNK